jgi:hypothetical protein
MSEDAEARRQRYLRAKELWANVGWVFDGFIKAEMAKLFDTSFGDEKKREHHYRRAKVAMELKGAMTSQLQEYEDSEIVREHKEHLNVNRSSQPLN